MARALITGGTAGIGLAVAEAFAARGDDVTIGGRRADGEEIARGVGCDFVILDVADEASVVAALDALGDTPLDVLVLNAGIAQPPGPLAAVDAAAAQEVVATNLLGVFWGLKHGPSRMSDGGSIIITSSISAVMGTPFEGLYGATKAAASHLARSGAIDLGPRGIRVNAVQPGPVWTAMNPMPEAFVGPTTPLGRKAQLEDVVGLYEFLASDASRHITGQAISVDGGITAGLTQSMVGLIAANMREGGGGMILGIHHVAISTGDADRALGFYRDLLGFEVVLDWTWPTGVAVADAITALEGSSSRQLMLRGGNAYIELFEYLAPPGRPGDPDRPVNDHGITHLCLDVTDVDAEYARLLDAGVRFHCPPQDVPGGVRTTYARDPDGNVVELQELTPANHRFAVPATAFA